MTVEDREKYFCVDRGGLIDPETGNRVINMPATSTQDIPVNDSSLVEFNTQPPACLDLTVEQAIEHLARLARREDKLEG